MRERFSWAKIFSRYKRRGCDPSDVAFRADEALRRSGNGEPATVYPIAGDPYPAAIIRNGTLVYIMSTKHGLEEWIVQPSPHRPARDELLVLAVQMAKTGEFTINQIRSVLGLPSVAHGHALVTHREKRS